MAERRSCYVQDEAKKVHGSSDSGRWRHELTPYFFSGQEWTVASLNDGGLGQPARLSPLPRCKVVDCSTTTAQSVNDPSRRVTIGPAHARYKALTYTTRHWNPT
jgi:hypothetical protein